MAIFNPIVAELTHGGEDRRLDALLKVVTHWLVVLSAPIFVALALLPDLALRLFPESYHAARTALLILLVGQAARIFTTPTARLIPMSGRAGLQLANTLAAFALNVGLNLWLIPRHGLVGAALASTITLAAWSALRVVQVWRLLGCSPFVPRTGLVLALLAVGLPGAMIATAGQPLETRIAAAGALLAAHAVVSWFAGRATEDAAVAAGIGRRLRLTWSRSAGR
jgi:O-antigen/teichoic acid export membrane protein